MKKKRVKFCMGCKAYSNDTDYTSSCDLRYKQVSDGILICPESGFCEKPRTYKELAKLMLVVNYFEEVKYERENGK